MASLASPIGPTIDVVARTVSRSVISGGGATVVQSQNLERDLEIVKTENNQQTQEISGLLGTVNNLKTEVEKVKRGGVIVAQLRASLVNVERNLEIQTTKNAQQTQDISGLLGTVNNLKSEIENSKKSSALVVQLQSSLVNVERNLQIQTNQNVQQTQEISSLKRTVDVLRAETTTLNAGLASISNLVQQDSALEKQQELQEAELERKLAETKIRMGKESQLEQKITNALVNPVKALQQKVTNIFGRIGEALTILFAGWLTNQAIEALKAASEGNKEKLEEIKDNVLNGIGDAIKVFTAIRTGFDLVIKTITGITGKIGGFVLKLATAPLKALRNTLQGAPVLKDIFRGPKPAPKPAGPGIIGGLFSGINSWLNFKNGENVDSIMNAALLLPTPPIVRGLLGLGVLADDIAEVFGGNIFGKNPNHERKAKEIAAEAKKQKEAEKPAATQTTAAKVEPAATAQTPMMGDKKDDKSETDPKNMTPGPVSGSTNIQPTSDAGVSPTGSNAAGTFSSTSLTSDTSPTSTAQPQSPMMSQASSIPQTSLPTSTPTQVQPQTPAIPPPSPEMVKNFEMAWKYKDNPMARGRIESAWDKMTVEQQQQAKSWAKSTGKDWTQMKLVEKPPAAQTSPLPSAQIQSLPKPTQNVGELAEPAPNVIMMPSSQSNTQQSSMSRAPTNGTDTPLISSSNPDNFYVLYSQLNYNVVV